MFSCPVPPVGFILLVKDITIQIKTTNSFDSTTEQSAKPDWVDHNKLWKILKEMGKTDHLTCLLRNQYAGQEAIFRNWHGTMNWFKTGKGVYKGCILSPYLFNLYAEYIIRNAELDEMQAGIKMAGKNINNLRYTHNTTPPLDEGERGEWKNWLKAQHSEN